MKKTGRTSSVLLHQRFDNFERFAASVQGWDVDFRQLDRGIFQADITQVGTPAVMITEAQFNRRLDQKGASPPGNWTFGLLGISSPDVLWRGQMMTDQMMAVFPPGSDLDASSPPGFHVLTISVPVERFDKCRIWYQGDSSRNMNPQYKVYKVVPLHLAAVRHIVHQAVSAVYSDRYSPEEMLQDLPILLAGTLATASSIEPEPAVDNRNRLVRTLTGYIDAHLRDSISLADLCAVANVSPRTVQYVFRDRFGISPKQYIQARRLHGVRSDLAKSNNYRGSISDVANKWGFWHMGQFAADYRRLFGELPSETMQRHGYFKLNTDGFRYPK